MTSLVNQQLKHKAQRLSSDLTAYQTHDRGIKIQNNTFTKRSPIPNLSAATSDDLLVYDGFQIAQGLTHQKRNFATYNLKDKLQQHKRRTMHEKIKWERSMGFTSLRHLGSVEEETQARRWVAAARG